MCQILKYVDANKIRVYTELINVIIVLWLIVLFQENIDMQFKKSDANKMIYIFCYITYSFGIECSFYYFSQSWWSKHATYMFVNSNSCAQQQLIMMRQEFCGNITFENVLSAASILLIALFSQNTLRTGSAFN